MKKIKEYKSVMNDKVGIRINGNESCKNIEKNELDEIIKEIKKCNDVLPDFEKSGRQDLIDELNQKLTILKSYLPKQLSVEEINEIVLYAIKEASASSMKDMGKVMALVSERTKGRADNKIISEIVKKHLQAQ